MKVKQVQWLGCTKISKSFRILFWIDICCVYMLETFCWNIWICLMINILKMEFCSFSFIAHQTIKGHVCKHNNHSLQFWNKTGRRCYLDPAGALYTATICFGWNILWSGFVLVGVRRVMEVWRFIWAATLTEIKLWEDSFCWSPLTSLYIFRSFRCDMEWNEIFPTTVM